MPAEAVGVEAGAPHSQLLFHGCSIYNKSINKHLQGILQQLSLQFYSLFVYILCDISVDHAQITCKVNILQEKFLKSCFLLVKVNKLALHTQENGDFSLVKSN